jgi:multidrug resistance efflux pump
LALAELELDQAQQEAADQMANAELVLASAETSVTAAQAAFPDLTTAQVRLEQARQGEADALYEYQKAQDRDWEPADVVEGYRRQYEVAVDNRVIAEADYNDVQSRRWANSQSVASAEISVEQAQLELQRLREEAVDPLLQWEVDKAKRNLTATILVAPFDGIVLEVAVRPGESIGTGQTILVLADVSRGELLTTVIEEDLPLVKPGQVAELYFDAAPDGIVSGTVGRIVPQRTEGDRPLYPVYVEVADLPVSLLPGMTADAVIVIERRQDVLRLPRAVVRAGEGDTATVQVWNGHEAEPREVRLGLRGDTYVEILSGLEEGEMVVGQ